MRPALASLLVLAAVVATAEATARFNGWGWAYNSGAALSRERRINIVTQMLVTGGNVAATSAFVKCVPNTVRKWCHCS